MEESRLLQAWVLGGDGRYPAAVQALNRWGLSAKTYGVPGMPQEAESLQCAVCGADLLVLGPGAFDGENLRVEGEAIEGTLLPRMLAKNAAVIGWSIPEPLANWLRENHIRWECLWDNAPFLQKNAAITAEGAVFLGMEAMERTLDGAQVLVVGWGRIGEKLAGGLRLLGAAVTVAARKPGRRQILRSLGYRAVPVGENMELSGYDLIYNTVPARVFSEPQLLDRKPGCVLVELASKPGGFPPIEGLHVIDGGGLPGKYAPETAGKLLAAAVLDGYLGEGRSLE